jgi:phage gpG-like protein
VTTPALQIQLDEDSIQVIARLSKNYSREQFVRAATKLFKAEGLRVAGHITKDLLSGQLLDRRTGALARSITAMVADRGGLPAMVVGVFSGPSVAYAGTHEFGTRGKNPNSPIPTIRPKRGKYLAMPVGSGALTPAGVSRYRSARQYPGGLGFVPIGRGNVAAGLIDENGEMQYLLLTHVDFEEKAYLLKGVTEQLDRIAKNLADELENLLSGENP